MEIHSSILDQKIPWTEEPGGLQSMGSQESDTTQRLNNHHHHINFQKRKITDWTAQMKTTNSGNLDEDV